MAHYIGPKHKLARREGVNLLDKTSSTLLRRLSIIPGLHGTKRRKKLSEYGQQLREKQRAKAMYGVQERQFKSLVEKLRTIKGDTGEFIIASLETRLDNVVYRLGFASSRFMARQLVSHGHILVNGKKLNIPSYATKEGDVVSLSAKMQTNPQVVKLMADEKKTVPAFLEKKATVGKLVRMPQRTDVEVPFQTQLIVEYYSR